MNSDAGKRDAMGGADDDDRGAAGRRGAPRAPNAVAATAPE